MGQLAEPGPAGTQQAGPEHPVLWEQPKEELFGRWRCASAGPCVVQALEWGVFNFPKM